MKSHVLGPHISAVPLLLVIIFTLNKLELINLFGLEANLGRVVLEALAS